MEVASWLQNNYAYRYQYRILLYWNELLCKERRFKTLAQKGQCQDIIIDNKIDLMISLTLSFAM